MLSNDTPQDRLKLIEALREAGLTASEIEDKNGKKRVIVPLIDTGVEPFIIASRRPELRTYFRKTGKEWPHRARLYICSASEGAPFEIGVAGHNGLTGEDYTPADWKPVETIEEAVAEFQNLWKSRDAYMNAFIADIG
jgi:hypothetical protein